MNNLSITQQVKEEAENLGVALDDGFEISDLPLIIEAVARVTRSCNNLWVSLNADERKEAVLDIVTALDDQYDFSGKISHIFVEWDVPGIPDNVADLILNETVTKSLVRSFYKVIVNSVFNSLDRKEIRGLGRGWQ